MENGTKITFEKAKELLDKDGSALLLDVREEEEYVTGHAIGAELFTLAEIGRASAAERISDKDTALLIYCRSGRRSRIAADRLISYGYTRVYDLGSLIGWPYGLE